MENKQKKPAQNHTVNMENRSKVVITGVTDTDKFTENSVLLYTCMGELIIKGRGLRVTLLSVESGDMAVEGDIDGIIYGDSQVKSPLSFMGRLLK
ncbi:MAG: YabP/YqfC family sporulation protein [Oscillospiraceae bacterium]|nr:YabP/YqfC family sporulation protein [Oscillospiraceae bacterium]MDY3793258.1 YabP/YqfC family sporulation protein [Oscillospiraceae bacterium]MDY6209208.1 YabP/YqfC family sporulation protein [Oscillospiraceae bacterium]